MKDTIIKGGRFGLERETLRVTSDGRMSQTPHSFNNKRLSRDFCENQLEIITSVCYSIDEAVEELLSLSREAEKAIVANNEYLWLYSNPPAIEGEHEIPVADYKGSASSKRDYRLLLQHKYGKKLMLYSGIHFNISFITDLSREYTDSLYMKLLKYSIRYSWLIVILTTASPICDRSLIDDFHGTCFNGLGSMRNSRLGYWNQFVPVLDYTSLDSYCKSIQNYIDKGALISASELYLPVRVKPAGINSLETLKNSGIDHIELRMFDINPMSDSGIEIKDLEFSYLLMKYFVSLSNFDFTESLQKQAVKNHKAAAEYDLDNVIISGKPAFEAVKEILDNMKEFFIGDDNSIGLINFQLNKLEKGKRYAEQIYNKFSNNYTENMLKKIKR